MTQRPRPAFAGLLVAFAILALTASGTMASVPSPASRIWQAHLGTAGRNGVSTLRENVDGAGSVYTRVRWLRPRLTYRQTIVRGTCNYPGRTVLNLRSLVTDGHGAAVRWTPLSVSQVRGLRAARRLANHFSLIVQSGRSRRCGMFVPWPPVAARPVPSPGHIWLIIFENKESSAIVGSSSAPYLNSLIRGYGLATNYTATTHPSQPNYIALVSGSTQGVTSNSNRDLDAPSLFDQVEEKGRDWRVFAQNVPLGCYTGATAGGGPDGPGTYARKHEPAISFTRISRSPTRCSKITDLSHFAPAAADLEMIIPNMCNSMHDCSVATGDAFLRNLVPRILASSAWMNGGLLVITFDEGTTNLGGGGKIATILVGPRVRTGYRSGVAHNHYSLLRTIQDAWRLGCLAKSCSANTLSEFFR